MTGLWKGVTRVVAVLCVSACSVSANALELSAPSQTMEPRLVVAETMTTRPIDDPSIQLQSAGAEPRASLTLRADPTTRQQIKVAQSGVASFAIRDSAGNEITEAGERANQNYSFPTLTVVATLQIRSSDGDRRVVDVSIDSASASKVGDSIMDEQAAALVSGLNAKSAVLAMDHSGRVIGAEPVIGDGERSGSLVLGFLDRNVITLADPLPTEPIGIGASWTISTNATSASLPATVTRHYVVTDITDTEVRASVRRSVTFASGTQQETKILSGSRLSGDGVAVWPLDGIIGVVSYTGSGTIKHDLGAGDHLVETIDRNVSSTILTLSAPPRPTTTTAAADLPTTTATPTTTPMSTSPTTTDPAAPAPQADQPTSTSPEPDTERPDEPGKPRTELREGPEAGNGAAAGDPDASTLFLTWLAAEDDVEVHHYEVFSTNGKWRPRSKANQDTQDKTIVAKATLVAEPTENTWSLPDKPGRYYYFIKAVDSAGNTSWRSGITEVIVK